MPHLRKIGEIARRCRREYLRNCLLVFLRDGRIRIEEVTAHILSVSLTRPFRPFVIFRRMIHNKIHAQADAFVVALLCEFSQIIHRSQLRFHLAEISHRIAAVRTSFRRIKERHQMDIIHIALLNIRQFLLHTFDVAREVINIHHHTEHIALAVPLALSLALRVERFQFFITLVIIALHLTAQFCEHIVIAVQFHIKPAQFVMMTAQPLRKDPVLFFLPLCFCLCFRLGFCLRFYLGLCLRFGFRLCFRLGLCLCFRLGLRLRFCLGLCLCLCFCLGLCLRFRYGRFLLPG